MRISEWAGGFVQPTTIHSTIHNTVQRAKNLVMMRVYWISDQAEMPFDLM